MRRWLWSSRRGRRGWLALGPGAGVVVGLEDGPVGTHAAGLEQKDSVFLPRVIGGCWCHCTDGKGDCGLRGQAAQACRSASSSLGVWDSGSRETSEQLLVGRGVWIPQCQQVSYPPLLPAPSTVINKYKRRRFQKTKNLLTGETEADPEMIKVHERSSWVLGASGCSWPSSHAGSQLAPPSSCCGGSVESPRPSDPQFSSKWG